MLSAAVGSQIAVADVVSEDENDVWLLCLLRGGWHTRNRHSGNRSHKARGIWRAELVMFSFGSIIVIVTIMFANGFQKDYPFIAYSYGAALVVFLIALTWPWVVPGGRLAAFFSNISYPLYVVHAIAGYSILLVLLDLGMKPTLALLLVTGCVIGLSALIHRFH